MRVPAGCVRAALIAVCAALGLTAALVMPVEAAHCPAPPAPAFTGPRIAVPAGTRIGLALGSGSMHGMAHIGVLREIEARGLPVDVVAGTSVGALVGALWASGTGAERLERMTHDGTLRDWSDFAASSEGLFTSDPMRPTLLAAFGGRPIESWPRRFGAVAADIATGARRVISKGDATTAVQASSAVPVMFRPVVVDGERLADGALVEPVPVLAARELGGDIVIAVDVAYRPHEEPASGLTGYAFQAMHILVNALAAEQLRSADVVIKLDLHERYMRCGNEAVVAAGRQAIAAAWPQIARAVAARTQRTATAR